MVCNALRTPTEPQLSGWAEIADGRDVLISAPTGSGKTLAAFLICIDRLVRAARDGAFPDETQVVYVSPLKALSNDVQRNLETPLAEIAALAEAQRRPTCPGSARAVRTGDTPADRARRCAKHPPHILVTTPESLFILLTAERSRAMLRTARTVIVDEIHAIADDKRGSHLALTLARLDTLSRTAARRTPQRIGLSATVRPIEEVANYLSLGRFASSMWAIGARWICASKCPMTNSAQSPPARCGRRSTTGSQAIFRRTNDAGLREHAPDVGACGARAGGTARAERGARRIMEVFRERCASKPKRD